MSARLLDESAGGFAVLVDGPQTLSVGQTAELHTDSGWCQVEVANITDVVDSNGQNTANLEESNSSCRVGLFRRSEQMIADELPMSLLGRLLHGRLLRRHPRGGALLLLGILLTLAIALVPWAWQSVSWRTERARPERKSPSIDADTKSPVRVSSDHVLARTPISSQQAGGGEFVSKWFSAVETFSKPRNDDRSAFASERDGNSAPKSEKELRDTVRRLAGATALTLSDVIEQLHLSDRQQARIRRIASGTSEDIRKLGLGATSTGSERRQIEQYRDMLLSESLRQALDVLTPTQRVQWDKLVAEGRDEGGPE